jgi:integrase
MALRRRTSTKGTYQGNKPERKPILSLLAARPGYGSDAILVFAYCGLRCSKLTALRVCEVDLAGCRLPVAEGATEVGVHLGTAAPKSKRARQVAIPRTVAEGCEDAVYAQNMPTGPGDPDSDRTL